MRARMLRLSVLSLSVIATGCQWVSPRSNFERDPLVMSHLSKGSTSAKRAYGSTEDPYKTGTYESRYLGAQNSGVEKASLDQSASANPNWPDYKSLSGRVHYRLGRNPGWYLHFTQQNVDDRFGNAVMLADGPKLGLLREGDLVRVHGEIVNLYPGDIRYRVDAVTILSGQAN